MTDDAMMRSRWTRDLSPLGDLGLNSTEYAALRQWMGADRPETIDALWEFIGTNPDSGLKIAADGLNQDKLLQVLLARAEAERRKERGPQSWSPLRRWLRQHALEMSIGLSLLVLTAAAVRIIGAQAGWWQAALTPQVVAVRTIAPGTTIVADDLIMAYLPRQGAAAVNIDQVTNRRLGQSVSAGSTFDRNALLALQLVARSPISAGARIRPEDLRLDWLPEKADALADSRTAAGWCARTAIRQDVPITQSDLTKCP